MLRWKGKAIPPDLGTSFPGTAIPILPGRPEKRQGRCYHNSDYVYILNELLIFDSEYISVVHLL